LDDSSFTHYGHFVDPDIDREWNAECSLMIRTRFRIDAARTTKDTKIVATDGLEKKNKYMSFEEQCDQLIEFKEEFGHCNVPKRHSTNAS